MIRLILVTRQRDQNEIVPARAEHYSTHLNNETVYGAGNAIDLDLETDSMTDPDPTTGKYWLKVFLNHVHCVKQVIWYHSDNVAFQTWTCTEDHCICNATGCSDFLVTVSTEGTAPKPVSDCRYGDIVKLEGTSFHVYEIAIIEKEG